MQAKEKAGIERAVMTNVFETDVFVTGVFNKFNQLVIAQDTFLIGFKISATPDQLSLFNQKMSDPVVAEVQAMRDIAMDIGTAKAGGFGVDAKHWFDTITVKINLLKEIEDYLADGLISKQRVLKQLRHVNLLCS